MHMNLPESGPSLRNRWTAGSRALILGGTFLLLSLFYMCWMTGLTFRFSEIELWPNFNGLSRAFAKGQLHLDEKGLEDFSLVNGKAYLYSGPTPALLRLPVVLVHRDGIPTGFMIACFVAGVCVVFILTLSVLVRQGASHSNSPIRVVFAVLIIFNGISLFIVTIPSFHHEAIACGMFFLIASIYYFFKVRASSYRPSLTTAILMGTSFVLCLGSRLSYAPSIGFLGLLSAWGLFKSIRGDGRREALPAASAIGGIMLVGVGLLLAYNYARYGAFLDSGMQYQVSNVFGDYFRHGYYFRYDHIPYNIWSFFFRLPKLIPYFPFIELPAYLIKVESVQSLPYYLINGNELSSSVFVIMPVLLLAFYPLVARLVGSKEPFMRSYGIIMGVLILQALPVSATVSTTLRYYYDFLPVMALAAYLGAVQLSRRGPFFSGLVIALAVASVILSFTAPLHGIVFYRRLINYSSPLGPLLLP